MSIWDRVTECQHGIRVEVGTVLLELLPVRVTR